VANKKSLEGKKLFRKAKETNISRKKGKSLVGKEKMYIFAE
jgi:hypothetical protein